MRPRWLCTSISTMPEAPPKLPSIWKGGWASKVGVAALGLQQQRQHAVRVVAVAEAGPEVDAPADAPAGRVVAAPLQRVTRAPANAGVSSGVIWSDREQRVQVRDVPVVDLGARRSQSSCHSCSWPLLPTRSGGSCSRAARHWRAKSASVLSSRAASAQWANRSPQQLVV